MRNLFAVLIALICLAGMPPTAHAAKPAKAIKESKEYLVLMPLRVAEEDQNLQGQMQSALVEGLQQKYKVFWGEEVENKARQIFHKENLKHECNEERCLQGIAEAFQSELLATAIITKQDGGYFLSLTIQNLYDHVVIFTKSLPCKGCTAFEVIDKLKELGGTAAPTTAVATAPAFEEPQPKRNQNYPDAVLWAEAQKGNTVEDYQVYLDTYPKGKYAPFAKARIKKLNEAAQAAAEQQEHQSWDTAQQENSEDSYGLYLKGYPAGRFARLAKVRSDKLKNDVGAKEESDLWKKADSSNDQAAVEGYLNRYPSGRYIAAASAKLKAIREEAAKGPAMVRIPGKNYEMGKYDVTQKEWRDIMGASPSKFTSCGDTCPVETVSWNDVQEFIQKLNAKTGKKYRLPNEGEWEYACYGGSQTEYCGGNDLDAVAWHGAMFGSGNSNGTTHPVGQKQANGYGLYDMSGNVWQWMENLYDSSRPDYGRALRGGSWGSGTGRLRATLRYDDISTSRGNYYDIGFRLARTLP